MDPRRLDRALVLAARAHAAQVRKGTNVPYIIHPVHVAFTLARHGFDDATVLAGVLHDTVEDCDVTLDDVTAAVGADVAAIVRAVTKPEDESAGWRARKEALLASVTAGGRSAAAVKAADGLHNARSMLDDLRAQGESLWSRFNAPRADQLWWYGAMVAACERHLGGHPLLEELRTTVAELVREAG